MPNSLAKKCVISLQSFAKDCIECNGAISFSAPSPVDLPALCAGSGVAQKRQKNAEGLGRRSAFFLGARLIGAATGRGHARAQGVAKRWARVAKKHAQNGNIGRKMAEDMKKGGFSRLFCAF